MPYWDTSTLAKFYVSEPDTSLFEAHLAATGPAVTSTLTRYELFRVAARKEAEGFIAAGTAEAIFARFLAEVESAKVTLIPIDQAVEDRFRALVLKLHRLNPPVVGRTLDCIHIAAAEVGKADEVVATDVGLRKAAAALGLKLFP